MMRLFIQVLAVLQMAALLVGCTQMGAPSSEMLREFVFVEPSGTLGSLNLTVVDAHGVPVAGALVQIGNRPGVPFADNVYTTNKSGEIRLDGEKSQLNWDEVPVNIEAPGYLRTTVFGVSPERSQISLLNAFSPLKTELVGRTTGYGGISSNGALDVSLVFPSLAEVDLGRLELTSLLGAGIDKVSVYGQELELPENLSVPQQTETYMGFIPVTLNKPQYRIRFPMPGDLGVSAVRAQFDFKQTVNDLRDGKSFFDLINRFQFRSMATRYLTLKPGVQSFDLPIDEVKLVPRIEVQASAIPKGYAMISILAQGQYGRFTVSDVKRHLDGESHKLVASERAEMGDGTIRLVRSLKKYEPRRTDFSGYAYEESSTVVSQIEMSSGGIHAPQVRFLEFLRPLSTFGRSVVLDSPVASTGGVEILQGRLLLSKVKPVPSGSIWLVDKTPVWEFRFQGVRSRIDIPVFGIDPWSDKGGYRWEHEYRGQDIASNSAKSGKVELTHQVRTAIDFVVK